MSLDVVDASTLVLTAFSPDLHVCFGIVGVRAPQARPVFEAFPESGDPVASFFTGASGEPSRCSATAVVPAALGAITFPSDREPRDTKHAAGIGCSRRRGAQRPCSTMVGTTYHCEGRVGKLEAFTAHNQRSNATLGAALVAASSLIVVATVGFLAPDTRDLVISLAAAALSAGLALLALLLPWETLSVRWLLAFPICGLTVLTVANALTDDVAAAYTGFFLLGFIYVGLTQPRGTSLVLALPALCAWLTFQGTIDKVVAVKIPITLALWIIVAELLALRTAETSREAGQLIEAARLDPLTGLASRADLGRVLADTVVGDALVMIDLDHFKATNDELGHAGGDRVLAEFGAELRAAIRSHDTAVRYGGDELLVVVVEAGRDGAIALVERLRSAWARTGHPTFSAGVAVRDASESADEVVARADRALYAAKAGGRDRIEAI